MKTPQIRCHCGRRIVERDVLHRHWYVRLYRTTFMFLRFRCARCRRVGERLIDQAQWSDAILRDVPTEMGQDEQRRVDYLGPISIHEQIDFHFALDAEDALQQLPPAAEPTPPTPETRRERSNTRPRADAPKRSSDARSPEA